MQASFAKTTILAFTAAIASCGPAGMSSSADEKLSTGSSGVAVGESVGIETLGGVFTALIPTGSELPASYSAIFSTATDNQPQVEVHVLAGTGELVADNRSLGRFIVADLRPAPRGVPQIEIALRIDKSGRLSVTARDLATIESSLSVSRSGAESDLVVSVGPK